ncbi:bifunctional chorismate-binding protein/class IV aminotransferase [Neisseria chenwenguii]|uniref:Bifunctional aminodeoxychorismate synthase component I/aminodeoxychorismate lyase n=1 Tax=Neisseria chenwenguii TaxID=1853278 RepID=A0A220S1S6_9NEIS|nr:chorismate-binding protein [Neisseria chenwenguii]ASK27397.1 bifunctional aminodeoxychorismate synthase component I/aminodeoxychorismate lyase [Neisseria chenwenguii]ROV56931.1 bifunctional aminodeoxychorismate synthase component I/aminodeoxychorismate lyase [Neisseria chenwenguii]
MPFFALFDDAVSNRAVLYSRHISARFLRADQLDSLDALLAEGWRQGQHAVIFADYEFGLPLVKLPSENSGLLALHWFAECENVNAPSWLAEHSDSLPAGVSTPESDVSERNYSNAINGIHNAIRRGDTYQINYTTRLHFQAYGSPVTLYRRLRQPVPYGVLACLPDSDGLETWTLCHSPELFLNISSDGLITTEPMKGTAPCLDDGHDAERAAALKNDPKNRAENVMIVDLLRNDLGKIAQTGKVAVPAPFEVSRFGSVWQMTSRIEAQAVPNLRAADIFRAAFPCGSITGAPKRKSMEIINRLETAPRGLYTGSIGFLKPNRPQSEVEALALSGDKNSDGLNPPKARAESGLGFEGVFNVAIRTLTLKSVSDSLYQGVYGVGSGIVIDSDPQSEYQECGWKARFLTSLAPEFAVFETIRVEQNQCALFDAHTGRLKNAARALNLALPTDFKQQILSHIRQMPAVPCRLKTTLSSDGLSFAHAEIRALQGVQRIILSPAALPRRDYLRRFKTTRRAAFDAAWQTAERQGAFDALLFNSDGLLLEGGRSNVFIKINSIWHTPATDLDILNGVMRQAVLADPQKYLGADQVLESEITREMLEKAEKICLSNALRGVFEVVLDRVG